MPPTDRFVARFFAEPPQEGLPYGRWAERLRAEFLAACLKIDTEGEEIGEPEGDITWFPDRTWFGRTYVPATARTTTGAELFGYVSFAAAPAAGEADEFTSSADFTTETAEANPDWKIDISDEVLGGWRGEQGNVAAITLFWGVPLVTGGSVVTAELAGLAVDQCALVENRFTLIAPDDYRGDTIELHLWDGKGTELAREDPYT